MAEKHNIPKENILRHKDIAPRRKPDVYDGFWLDKHKTYQDYVNSLFSKIIATMANDYLKIFNEEKGDYEPIFKEHKGDAVLPEAQIKALIDIASKRLFDRLMAEIEKKK